MSAILKFYVAVDTMVIIMGTKHKNLHTTNYICTNFHAFVKLYDGFT